jgi:hypothetical protein
MARGYIFMGAPRSMVSYVAGMRPNKDPKSKSFLAEGATFFNFVDNVLCVGTGAGGWVEYQLVRLAVVSEGVANG